MWILWVVGFISVVMLVSYQTTNTHEKLISDTEDANKKYLENIGFIVDTRFDYNDSIYGTNYRVFVDNHNNKLMIMNGINANRAELNFKDIIGMEIKEDGVSTNGVGRAAVGGLLFGGAGAVVGAVTGKKTVQNIKIIIYRADVVNPTVEMDFKFSGKIKCDSSTYLQIERFERRLDATIRAILAKNDSFVEEIIQTEKNDLDKIASHSDNISESKPVSYFLMYRMGSSNPGKKKYEGMWILNGFAVNYAAIEGQMVDLYSEDMKMLSKAHVQTMLDFTGRTKDRVSLILDDYTGDLYPDVAYAVESGKLIDINTIRLYCGSSTSL